MLSLFANSLATVYENKRNTVLKGVYQNPRLVHN